MSQAGPKPHEFEDPSWWMKSVMREWWPKPAADLHGSIEPNVVQAASGHTLVVKLQLGPKLALPTGAHVTMEVPATWEAHLGNCFRRAIRTVGNREQVRPGYGAFTDVVCSNPDVGLAWAASYGRIIDLVDVVVTQGEVAPGDEIRIILGPPDGNLIQVQKHAQMAILTVGVDLTGTRQYRRAATHPTIRIVGAWADRLRVFAPAVVPQGEPATLRVLPVDIYSFNTATGYQGTVGLTSEQAVVEPGHVDIDTGLDPFGAEATVRPETPGVHYVTAVDQTRGLSGRSNPITTGWFDGRGVYFGEMHSQMWHSMGTGTTQEFFERGRDVAGLDFCAPANHYNHRFEVTDELWQELVDTCNAFNEPGKFVTMVSYEWAGPGSGHKNIYYRGDTGEFAYWYAGEHKGPEDLWKSLEGRDVLTVPHHPRTSINWSYRNDAHQRLVEICSKWDIAEEAGPRCVQTALAMGQRLGFVGGTDSHYGLANQGSYHVNDGNGLSCVIATEKTRDAIWQALYDRRCYATTGDRIVLDFRLNGQPMGSDLPVDLAAGGSRHIEVRAAGTHRIDRVEIIRNNEVVFEVEPGREVWEGEWTDDGDLAELAFEPTFDYDRPFVYYYLRVRQGNRQMAWASPIWLTQTSA